MENISSHLRQSNRIIVFIQNWKRNFDKPFSCSLIQTSITLDPFCFVSKQLSRKVFNNFFFTQQRLHPRTSRTHAIAWRPFIRPVLSRHRISFTRRFRRWDRETFNRKYLLPQLKHRQINIKVLSLRKMLCLELFEGFSSQRWSRTTKIYKL